MSKIQLDDWFSVIGHIAVVIGLVVVAVELRQASIVANGELTTQFVTNWQEFDRSRQDPAFAAVYAKSIEQQGDLTLTEMVQLDGYYWAAVNQLELARMLVEPELFFSTYEDIVRENVRLLFLTPYSHAWWRANRHQYHPDMVAIVDDELGKVSPDGVKEIFETIRVELSEQVAN